MCVSEDSPSHGSSIGDKVSDWLHDVPGVLPPGQPGQHTELGGHQPQPRPGQQVGPLRCVTDDLLSLVLKRFQLFLEILQFSDQFLFSGKLILFDVESFIELRHQKLDITDLSQIFFTETLQLRWRHLIFRVIDTQTKFLIKKSLYGCSG